MSLSIVGDLFEQVRLEMPADHRRGSQHVLRFGRHALHPALQHDAHRVGELDIVEIEVARPLVARVEQPSFVLQVPEQLGDEERISAGVIGELPHEPGWRVWLAERGEHALHFGVRKRAQRDRAGVALADELIERRLDRLRREDSRD